MNVKELVNLVEWESEGSPLNISISAPPEMGDSLLIVKYEPCNSFHVAAYGDWKVRNFTAQGTNKIDITIDCTPCTPIIEN